MSEWLGRQVYKVKELWNEGGWRRVLRKRNEPAKKKSVMKQRRQLGGSKWEFQAE
jgi:hypothetical protein